MFSRIESILGWVRRTSETEIKTVMKKNLFIACVFGLNVMKGTGNIL